MSKGQQTKAEKEKPWLEKAAKFQDGLLVDNEFPPSSSSLSKDLSKPAPDANIIQWRRPSEFCKGLDNPALFVNGFDEADVVQGTLGDCWFLGALSVVATRADLLENLIISTHPECGFYQFQFFKKGKWVTVTVDDYLPCGKDGFPIYAKSKDYNELWVALFEKAYAKLHRSYSVLEGGTIDYALVDLTGGVSDVTNFATSNADTIWSKLQQAKSEGWLMGTASIDETAVEEDNGMGILHNHAYGVIDSVVVNGEKLIRIRNPWGKLEWKGRWCDGSREWTPEVLKQLNYSFGDDGTFWMCLEDFFKYYNRLYVIRLYHDEVGKVWERYLVQGEWKGVTAGGSTRYPTFSKNPQFTLTCKSNKPTKIFVELLQQDFLYDGKESQAIGFIIAKTSDFNTPVQNVTPENVVLNLPFKKYREVNGELEIQPGQNYVIIPSTFDAGIEEQFTLTIYAEDSISFQEVTNGPRPIQQTKLQIQHEGLDPDDFITETEKTYPMGNGATYHGNMENGKPNGKGIFKFANGDVYTGNFVDGFFEGDGHIKWDSGDIYKGQFKNDVPHGKGVYLQSDGGKYEGEFSQGVRHGKGKFTFPNKDQIETEFDRGQPKMNTKGIYLFWNGDRYEGELNGIAPHGKGTLTCSNGDSYQGDWSNGAKNGFGKYQYANGSVFEGEYRNNIRHGKGKLVSNGDTYEGDFSNGLPNGKGVYIFENGDRYEGDFFNDLFHGKGAYISTDGSKFVGDYKEGKRDGRGRLDKSNGDYYEGEFKENLFCGQGTYFWSKSGNKYQGEFVNGKPHGQGTLLGSNGTASKGVFENGKMVQVI